MIHSCMLNAFPLYCYRFVEVGLNIPGSNTLIKLQVLPDLFYTLRTCEDGLKEFITRKLGTLVFIVRQVRIV